MLNEDTTVFLAYGGRRTDGRVQVIPPQSSMMACDYYFKRCVNPFLDHYLVANSSNVSLVVVVVVVVVVERTD